MPYNPERHNIKVTAKSEFRPNESDFGNNRYFFIYNIEISNIGNMPAKLLRRHWFVTNGDGQVEEVEGEGVVGQTPLILPNTAYHYTSASIIGSPVGTMHGSYQFLSDDGTIFTALIPAFTLAIPGMIH